MATAWTHSRRVLDYYQGYLATSASRSRQMSSALIKGELDDLGPRERRRLKEERVSGKRGLVRKVMLS